MCHVSCVMCHVSHDTSQQHIVFCRKRHFDSDDSILKYCAVKDTLIVTKVQLQEIFL